MGLGRGRSGLRAAPKVQSARRSPTGARTRGTRPFAGSAPGDSSGSKPFRLRFWGGPVGSRWVLWVLGCFVDVAVCPNGLGQEYAILPNPLGFGFRDCGKEGVPRPCFFFFFFIMVH